MLGKRNRSAGKSQIRRSRLESLEERRLLAVDLVAHWSAESLRGQIDSNSVVADWTENVFGVVAEGKGQGTWVDGALGARAAMRFDAADGTDAFVVTTTQNPLNDADDFSITVVFQTVGPLRGESDEWFKATGLVDANALGLSADWGVVLNSHGQVGFGMGEGFLTESTTLYSNQAGLADGQMHMATAVRSGDEMAIYIDHDSVTQMSGASEQVRRKFGLSIGDVLNGGGPFSGDIGEVRLYSSALTPFEVADLHQELESFYQNVRPVATPDSYTTMEDGLLLGVSEPGVLANDTDADGDVLSAVLVSSTQFGSLSLNPNGSFVYVPNENFHGVDSFQYSATDFRSSEPVTVTINVTPTYDPPQLLTDSYKSLSGENLVVDAQDGLLANDINIDQNPLSARLASQPPAGQGTVNLATDGSFVYSPNGFAGTTSFQYQIDDGVQLSPSQTVTLVINSPPVVHDDVWALNEDTVFQTNDGVLANDVDREGNGLTVTLIEDVQHGSLELQSNGQFVYTPNLDYVGSDLFRYRVSDGIDESEDVATVRLQVVAVNDAPVAEMDSYVLRKGQILGIAAVDGVLANDSDVDDQALGVRLVSGPVNGSLDLRSDGSLRYEPNVGFAGRDAFTYVAVDASAAESEPVEVALWVAVETNDIVINELHYDPPVVTTPAEFIELYNATNEPADISGWYFDDGVTFAFPDNTVILPNAYLLVAESPETMSSEFGVSAFGPWQGSLANQGETLTLRNAVGRQIDHVDYRQGFPWPIASGGEGPSLELIHPSLENDLGGSWRSGSEPTPGRTNSIFASNAAPQIRKVQHQPQQPTSIESTTITSEVTDPQGVAAVELEYQVVLPGEFVPALLPVPLTDLRRNADTPREPNPAYFDPANWTKVVMRDDGQAADEAANDGVYSVTLPAQINRALVRYRITVMDTLGESVLVPYDDDRTENFAYFVYDGVPEYEGTSAEVMESLPVYHVIARANDVSQVMAYRSTDQIAQGTQARFAYNWPAAFVYDGQVYDNISFRLRGANGRYQLRGKRSMRFRFNDGEYFAANNQDGEPFPEPLRTLTTGKMFDNRGTLTYALNETVNMYLYNLIGLPAPETQYVHFRMIDSAEEQPDAWSGDFWGLNFVLETYDSRFLDNHDLEPGNLYKLINQTTNWEQQQRYQAPSAVSDGSDHDNIERNLRGSNTAEYIDAHVNLEKYYLFHALAEAIRHYDFWPSANKNMVYYFEPDYLPENDFLGKLWILPWDTDASWGPTWNRGHDVVYNALFPATGSGADNQSTPELWPAYFNVVREIRDLLWQPDQIEPIVQQFADVIKPLEAADLARWRGGPSTEGSYSGLTGAGVQGIDALVVDMLNFAFEGGNWPGGSVGRGGRADDLDALQGTRGEGDQIPETPTISYLGEANFPVNALRFGVSAFADPQGNDTFAAMEWRIAEITDPAAPAFDPNAKFKPEWMADWESGELTDYAAEIQPPSTAVSAGHTYRARVRMQDDSGRWSHWSAPLQFTASAPETTSLADAVRIAEIHYHPANPTVAEVLAGFNDADDFEFIELVNISDRVIDLSGLALVQEIVEGEVEGVTFEFAGGAVLQLEPGQRVVVAEDVGAFQFRYGSNVPLAGEWSGGLANSSELLTMAADGITIQQFRYHDDWYEATDGDGFSLQVVDVNAALVNWNEAAGWMASSREGGSPGTDDSVTRIPGDANGDGVFNSSDFVTVFQAGEYEDSILGNSTFEEGDWNGDGDFTTADLVYAFTEGNYVNLVVQLDDLSQSASMRAAESAMTVVARDRFFEHWDGKRV
ncbi:MAG: tandem-95 repeat protein [Planctomycetales bacterium]|nr:tandem-95 repeat protein [Planctomycetales bacterium]